MEQKFGKTSFSLKALILLVVLFFLGLSYIFIKPFKEKPQEGYTQVKAIEDSLFITIRASGLVNPMNRLEIKPPIAGRIEKVLIEEGNYVKKGTILAWMSSTERAALLDAARAGGEGALKEWEDVYKPTPVIAPLDGMVIANNIKPGQTVVQQDVLIVLSDLLIIKAKVDETDISHIFKKQKVIATIDSFPNHKINAVVKHIAYEAITENSVTMYEIEIEPMERPDFLRSGMSATIDFILVEKDKVILVPENAVYQDTEGNNYVLLYTGEDNQPKPTNIKIGLSHDAKVEVMEGIQADEVLLVRAKKSSKEKKEKAKNPFSPFPKKK